MFSLTAWAADPPDAACHSDIEPAVTEPVITKPVAIQAVASPNMAFARYMATLGRATRSPEWQTVAVEIEASLPGLAKQGRLEAIRRCSASGNLEYQVLHIRGRFHRKATGDCTLPDR